MDILAGPVLRVAMPEGTTKNPRDGVVEGRVLAVRGSRGAGGGPSYQAAPEQPDTEEQLQDRRRRRPGSPQADPAGARVLTLLVPDPQGIPEDLTRASYRVIVRFIRKG